MWLPFRRILGGKRVVPGGQRFRATCPTCERSTELEEIELGVTFGPFLLDMRADRERALRCRECGDLFDPRYPPPRDREPGEARYFVRPPLM